MYNEVKHLHNGLTVLFCEDTKLKSIVQVYLDTEVFHYISSMEVEWKIRYYTRKNGVVDKFISGKSRLTGKYIKLKRVIGEHLYGKGTHFTLINENCCDLRKCNIFPFKRGTLSNPTVRQEMEKLKEQLQPISPLIEKEDTVTTANSNNVQVIEYGEKILILENEKVVSELSRKHLNAILNKYPSQLQLL